MDKAKVDIESLAVSRILVVVAHPDDIESWCAGTVCRFVDAGKHDDWVGRCYDLSGNGGYNCGHIRISIHRAKVFLTR